MIYLFWDVYIYFNEGMMSLHNINLSFLCGSTGAELFKKQYFPEKKR